MPTAMTDGKTVLLRITDWVFEMQVLHVVEETCPMGRIRRFQVFEERFFPIGVSPSVWCDENATVGETIH